MGKSADAPDTVGAAREQGQQAIRLNEAQTRANRPNQYNPWGQTEWTSSVVHNPVTGEDETQWTQTETLDPRLQASLDAQFNIQQGRSELAEGMMARAFDEYQNPMDFSQYGGPIQMQDDYGSFRQSAEDAAYQRATSRLDPQFQAQEQQLTTRLRNQGLQPGDQAYDAAMANFQRGRTDAYEQARLGATSEGRTEAQQGFSQAMQQNQLANQLRSQQIQEDLYKRGYPLQEVERMLQGQGITGGPPSSGGTTSTENSTLVGNMLMGES